MNKPSKCKNCQWYGKPYWSIINPCDNCPNENDYKTIITIDGKPVIEETLTEEEYKTFEELKKELGTDYDIKLYDMGKSAVKEIERLNNIINKLEEHLINQINDDRSVENHWLMGVYDEDKEILNKLRELKEGK